MLAAALPVAAAAQEVEETASFTVDVKLGESEGEKLNVYLICREAGAPALNAVIRPGDSRSFAIPVGVDSALDCSITADALPGRELHFLGDGGSETELDGDGCHFSGVRRGHANFCQIQIEVQATTLTVYKRWIGSRGAEGDVEINLICDGVPVDPPRRINAGRPDGWTLTIDRAAGMQCTVIEEERDDFLPDASDCENLLIRSGTREECTMVNTKIVKMIQTLNRYGLFVMIGLVLAIGLAAARKVAG